MSGKYEYVPRPHCDHEWGEVQTIGTGTGEDPMQRQKACAKCGITYVVPERA